MSMEAIQRAFAAAADREMTPTQQLVLLAIADRMNERGEAWPSVGDICRRTKLADRSVQRAIRDLVQRRWLIVTHREAVGGRSASSLYRMGEGVTVSPSDTVSDSDSLSGVTLCRGEGDTVSGGGGQAVTPEGDTVSPPYIESEYEPPKEPKENRAPVTPKGGQVGLFGEPALGPKQGEKRLSKAAANHLAIALLRELGAARIRVDKGCRMLDEVEGNLMHIRGLLLSGHTAEQIRHVIAVCEERAKRSSTAREHFNAVSPFRPKNFGIWLGMTIQQAQVAPGPLTRPAQKGERVYVGTELPKFVPPPEGFKPSNPDDEKEAGF